VAVQIPKNILKYLTFLYKHPPGRVKTNKQIYTLDFKSIFLVLEALAKVKYPAQASPLWLQMERKHFLDICPKKI
jgi:hypothetical protein